MFDFAKDPSQFRIGLLPSFWGQLAELIFEQCDLLRGRSDYLELDGDSRFRRTSKWLSFNENRIYFSLGPISST